MKALNCETVRAAASAHRDRKLPAAQAAHIDAHLRVCESCRSLHALDGDIAKLLRHGRKERELTNAAALAARVRGSLIEHSLEEIRRPAWQRGVRRGLSSGLQLLQRTLVSRVLIGLLIGLSLFAAYQVGKREVLAQMEAKEDPADIETGEGLRDGTERDSDLPQLRRLLRDFDAEASFRRAWSPPEAGHRVEEELNPDDFQLVSARRKSSPTPLRAPAELNHLLQTLRLEREFDVIIEARIVRNGRVTQFRLRRQAGGELEIIGE
jgi:putative zinc finger protein